MANSSNTIYASGQQVREEGRFLFDVHGRNERLKWGVLSQWRFNIGSRSADGTANAKDTGAE